MSEPDKLVTILLTEDALAEMHSARLEASDLVGVETWPEESDQDKVDLETMLGMVQTRLASLEEKRLEIAGPLSKAKAALDEMFRVAKNPWQTAKDRIKDKLEGIITRRDEMRRLALAAASHATKAADPVTASVALAVAADHAPVKSAQHGSTWAWEWDLLDISQVPVDFLALNPATMKMYVARFKNSETIPEIPGLTFRRVAKVIAQRG